MRDVDKVKTIVASSMCGSSLSIVRNLGSIMMLLCKIVEKLKDHNAKFKITILPTYFDHMDLPNHITVCGCVHVLNTGF